MGRGVSCEAESEWSEDEPCGYAPMPTRAEETEALLACVRELATGLTVADCKELRFFHEHQELMFGSIEDCTRFSRRMNLRGITIVQGEPMNPLGRAVLRVLAEKEVSR